MNVVFVGHSQVAIKLHFFIAVSCLFETVFALTTEAFEVVLLNLLGELLFVRVVKLGLTDITFRSGTLIFRAVGLFMLFVFKSYVQYVWTNFAGFLLLFRL